MRLHWHRGSSLRETDKGWWSPLRLPLGLTERKRREWTPPHTKRVGGAVRRGGGPNRGAPPPATVHRGGWGRKAAPLFPSTRCSSVGPFPSRFLLGTTGLGATAVPVPGTKPSGEGHREALQWGQWGTPRTKYSFTSPLKWTSPPPPTCLTETGVAQAFVQVPIAC